MSFNLDASFVIPQKTLCLCIFLSEIYRSLLLDSTAGETKEEGKDRDGG